MTQPANQSQKVLYEEWLSHPVTVRLNHFLQDQKQALMEQWSRGNFTAAAAEQTAQLSANAVGQCEVLSVLIDLEFQQLFPEPSNE